MTLAAALAVLVMMAALATAHPAQHKLHQVEITNFDVHSLLSTFCFPKVSMSKCKSQHSSPGAADELQPSLHPDAEHLRRAARHHEGQPPQGTVHK